MKMGLSAIVVLIGVLVSSLNGQSALPERHSLYYVYTALSKALSAPGIYEFIGIGYLDGRKIDYYNSEEKMKIPQQPWMDKKLGADYWEKGTQSRRSKEQWFKVNVNILMERNRQNGSDVHVLNWKHGCEVEKQPDGSFRFVKGADQYSYDGQDFLSFDVASMQWVAPVPEAVPTKKKWDGVPILNQYTKGYLEKECVGWLERFLEYSDDELGRLIQYSPPKVHLYAQTSKDKLTMTCLATGFYPREIEMFIRKKGVPVHRALSTDVYPNGDGTHQARLHVVVPMSEANDYDCWVSHVALQTPIVSRWESDGILCDESSSTTMIAGAAVGAGVLGITAAIVIVMKKASYSSSKDTPGSSSSSDRDSKGSDDPIM